MERYKSYWIHGWGLPATMFLGLRPEWYGEGDVSIKEPSGRIIVIERFESKERFLSLKEAEAYGLGSPGNGSMRRRSFTISKRDNAAFPKLPERNGYSLTCLSGFSPGKSAIKCGWRS